MTPRTLSYKELRENTWGTPRFSVMAAYQCDHCGKLLLAAATLDTDPGNRDTQIFEALEEYIETTGLVTWLPPSGEGRDFADVPDHIASAASETYQCFSIGAYRAALSLSRAVVEATAKHFGITNGLLHAKIERLVADGHLRPGTGAMAHEIRHWGNDMAHGDFAVPIARDAAEAVLTLMDEVLQEAFQGPARLERVQQLRQTAAEEQQT